MLARALVVLASAALSSSGPLTIPLTPEGSLSDVIPDHLRPVGKAFHLLSHVDRPLPTLSDVVQLDKLPTCNVTMQLEWSAHIGPMASAPLIIPSTEGKRIAIATLHEDIELLDAGGRRIPGWPVRYPGSRFFGSPMLLDVDQDGTPEVVAADDQGNVFFMRSNGEYLEDYHIQLPKLRVRRDWVELTRNPGSGTGTDGSGTEPPMISLFDSFQLDGQGAPQTKKKGVQDPLYVPPSEGVQGGGATDSRRRRLSEEVENEEVLEDVQLPEHWDAEEEDRGFFIDHSHDLDHDPEGEGLAEGQGYGYGAAGSTVRHANDDMGAYAYGYMSRMRRGHQGQGLTEEEQGLFVSLDPHLLAAPVLYLDGTSPLLLFPVSYYLNEEVAGVDRSLYFASALLCWEVVGEYYKYTAHLDLSTNHTPTHRAELLSTPQVVDLDGDGTVEVLVHTSLGVLYVLDSEGRPRRQTQAMQTHATQTRLLAVDLTGGQSLEVIAADAEGSVLALTTSLEVLWDEQLSCPVHITPSVVDIDDDGVMDVLVAVTCGDRGLVYALAGDSGRTLRRWALPRPVSATITTALLGNRLYLFIPTYDGHVYIVSAEGVCAQSLDAGTSSYTPVLLADITSSGVLDILTTSLSGDIALYSTPYEVPSSARGLAGHVGVVLSAREKARLRHLATAQAVNISLHFQLLDGRPPRNLSALHPNARYMVTISRQSAGTPEEVLFSESYRHAGSYTASISLPGPSDNLLVVRVVDEHLLGGEDSLPVQVSAEFHAWIKYFVAGPVVLFCSIVYLKISSSSSSST